jgi:hypothetical protein
LTISVFWAIVKEDQRGPTNVEETQKPDPRQTFLAANREYMDLEFVSVREGAARAKLSTFTIYRWIKSGKLPAFGHGHATRIRMGDLLAPKINERQ